MIEVDNHDKVRIAKFGANKLFEVDYDTRKSMDEQKLIDLFNQTWTRKLENMVLQAEKIECSEVKRRFIRQDIMISLIHNKNIVHFTTKKQNSLHNYKSFENTEYKLTQNLESDFF